jgi:hypothetical protein
MSLAGFVLALALAGMIGAAAGWLTCVTGETALSDSWQREAARHAQETRDVREQLAAWEAVARESAGVIGWHLDGTVATWADLGLAPGPPADTAHTQGDHAAP